MADQSLFGMTDPELVKQLIQAEEAKNLVAQAQFTPAQMQNFIQLQAGQQLGKGLGGIVGSLFGVEAVDPRVKRAQQAQSIINEVNASGLDPNTPEYLMQVAKLASSRGLPDLAQMAATKAEEFRGLQMKTFKEQAAGIQSIAAAQRERASKAIQIDLGDRVQLRDPVTNEVIEEIKKGITPAQQQKEAERLAEEKPGFIGKTGAYRNQFGEVIPGSEMQKQRSGFQSAEDLLSKLNSITETDIKNSESIIDYTQSETRKTIAGKISPKTLDAQSKIAASQLLQQIESLPPGSASDADMRSAARSFPGYGDATALRNWVNRTKLQLEDSLARQAEQYGFSRKIKANSLVSSNKAEQKALGGVPKATKRWNPVTQQLEDL